ncbi:MAG: hypothetical protein G01um101466_581 [Parcubacteria group bacterium Gr01-1014_66]|nr:MAG: hypothetical protein G01um101466_581 [Parcubacteria group bacterium Gr01-1014_66]
MPQSKNHFLIFPGLPLATRRMLSYGAFVPGGIRTPNNSFEGWCDIHFTTETISYMMIFEH